YNAYGQIINETYHQDDFHALPDNPLRFQGQYYDEETGLHYNLNRYYDPFTGRYITQDPLGMLGGLNSYQYAGSDPINWVDPLGLIKVENSGFEGIAGKETGGYLNQPEQGGTLNIGAGNKPIEGAYNISHPDYPMAEGVYPGNANDLSNIATGSQNKIIMDNPFGYYPLNDEVLRVLNNGGTIIIRGNQTNKYMKNLEIIAKEKGLQLVNKRQISSAGYAQSSGEPIKSKTIDEYIFKK
ncbi:MAG: RHS repeat-associated core domain-containing protein, partial [Gilliamella sp.]